MERDREISLLNHLWQHVCGGKRNFTLRQGLASAVPFTLDSETVRLVDEMTRESWGDLRACQINRMLSRLPFEKVWIEYPIDENIAQPGNADMVSMIGWYCERIDETHWQALCVMRMEDDPLREPVIISPLHICFNTEGDFVKPIGANVPFRSIDSQYMKTWSIQAFAKKLQDVLRNEGEYGELSGQESHTMWASVALSTSFVADAHRPGHTSTKGEYKRLEGYIEFIQFQFKIVPFLLQALALINVVPKEEIPYKPSGSFRARGQIKQFLVNRTVKLTIPAKVRKPGSWARKLLKTSEVRMRLHRCRGHWRVYRNDDGSIKLRTWVRDHLRGDASIGFVNQDYEVRA